jgi:hypothetical protein
MTFSLVPTVERSGHPSLEGLRDRITLLLPAAVACGDLRPKRPFASGA